MTIPPLISALLFELGVILFSIGVSMLFVPRDEIRRLCAYGKRMKQLDMHGISSSYLLELLFQQYITKYAPRAFFVLNFITAVTLGIVL